MDVRRLDGRAEVLEVTGRKLPALAWQAEPMQHPADHPERTGAGSGSFEFFATNSRNAAVNGIPGWRPWDPSVDARSLGRDGHLTSSIGLVKGWLSARGLGTAETFATTHSFLLNACPLETESKT